MAAPKFLECAICQKEVELIKDFEEIILESSRCAYCEGFFCCERCEDEHECYGHAKVA